jgi:hypothetical protein
MEVANEIRDKRNEPLVRRESVKKVSWCNSIACGAISQKNPNHNNTS